jgi:hypothetical protein
MAVKRDLLSSSCDLVAVVGDLSAFGFAGIPGCPQRIVESARLSRFGLADALIVQRFTLASGSSP